MRALKRLGFMLDLNQIDARKGEPDLRTIIRVDETILTLDRAMITTRMLEDYHLGQPEHGLNIAQAYLKNKELEREDVSVII